MELKTRNGAERVCLLLLFSVWESEREREPEW